MNEHDEEEDELRELHHQFDVLLHIHLLNDTTKSRHSDQLQQTEQGQDLVPLLGNEEGYVVEWNCRQDVYGKSSFEIFHGDCLLIKNFLACKWIVICRFELKGNINAKYDVNQGVDDQESTTFHSSRFEAYFKWNSEAVVDSQNDDEYFKVDLPWVIDSQDTLRIRHHFFSMLLYVLI